MIVFAFASNPRTILSVSGTKCNLFPYKLILKLSSKKKVSAQGLAGKKAIIQVPKKLRAL